MQTGGTGTNIQLFLPEDGTPPEGGDGWKVWDVASLLNDNDLDDLSEKLNTALRRVWDHQLDAVRRTEAARYLRATTVDKMAIQVFQNKTLPAVWLVDVSRVYEPYGYQHAGIRSATVQGHLSTIVQVWTTKGNFHICTLKDVQDLMKLLVRNSYVQYEDSYYKQIRRIPMGINPFLANFYLTVCCYEYEFFEQFEPILGDIQQLSPEGDAAGTLVAGRSGAS